MHPIQHLFTVFLILLLMTQTPKSNWLTKKLHDTGYFGTYRDVQKMLFAVTIGSVVLFFGTIYHFGIKSPGSSSSRDGRVADVSHVVETQKPDISSRIRDEMEAAAANGRTSKKDIEANEENTANEKSDEDQRNGAD